MMTYPLLAAQSKISWSEADGFPTLDQCSTSNPASSRTITQVGDRLQSRRSFTRSEECLLSLFTSPCRIIDSFHHILSFQIRINSKNPLNCTANGYHTYNHTPIHTHPTN